MANKATIRIQGATAITGTSGTPVALSTNSFIVKSFTVQLDPAATGPFGYLKDAAGNIMGKISPGQSFTPPQPVAGHMGSFDLSDTFVDWDHTGDQFFLAFAS